MQRYADRHAAPVIQRVLAACAMALLLGLAPAQADNDNQLIDRIVAVVNDGIILQSELDAEIAMVREQMSRRDQRVPPDDILRQRVLENLVTDRLQLQQARDFGIRVDDEMVNQALNRLARDQDMSVRQLREELAAQGIDFSRVRRDVRDQLTISQLRQRRVASGIVISEQEVDDFLDRLEREEDGDVEYRVHHILLAVAGDAPTDEVEETQQRARELVRRLRDGADFADLAAAVSDGPQALSGGDLGWRGPASLPSLFAETLGDMAVDDISDPVRSANGFHILRLADQRGGTSQTFVETRARHILIREREDSDMADMDDPAHREIAELRRRIEAGASFEELARAHSEDPGSARRGGDLGWFGPGEMTPAFQEAVDDLPVGRLSEPFRSPFGWHIVEVLDKRERADVERLQRAQAQQALYRQRMEEETQRWLRELRDEAFVEYRLDG